MNRSLEVRARIHLSPLPEYFSPDEGLDTLRMNFRSNQVPEQGSSRKRRGLWRKQNRRLVL
jgi:hypothetical protein